MNKEELKQLRPKELAAELFQLTEDKRKIDDEIKRLELHSDFLEKQIDLIMEIESEILEREYNAAFRTN